MTNAMDIFTVRTAVSILVFVELALDVHSARHRPANSGVSILVFVELALDDRLCRLHPISSPVSILVFVELALDARTMSSPGARPISFNPCFRGTCS